MSSIQQRYAFVCTVLAGALMIAGIQNAQAAWPDWDQPTQITDTPSRFASDPHMAIDATGAVHLVYQVFLDNTGEYYYTTNSGGSWAAPYVLHSTSGKGSGPKIVITPDDVLHAFFGKGDLYERTKPLAGGTWTAAEMVAISPQGGHINNVAVDASGGMYFLYTHLFDDSAPMRSAIWGRYKPLGGSWGTTELIVGTNDDHMWHQGGTVFLDESDGSTFWVVYSYDGTNYKKIRPAGGSWQPSGNGAVLPDAGGGIRFDWSPVSNELAMSFARDVDGDSDGMWFEVFVKYSYDNGASWTSPVNVCNSPALDRMQEMTYDSNGNLHIVWQGWDCDGYGCPPMVRYVSRIAGTWSPVENLTPDASAGTSFEAIKVSSDTLHVCYAADSEVFVRSKWNAFPAGTGTLTGFVRDQHGAAVPAAQVHALGAGRMFTHTDGSYTLSLPAYTFDIVASKDYYQSETLADFTIAAGQTISHDFVINALPPGPVWLFSVAAADSRNHLWWYNPSSENYYATMIRYSTTDYPATPTEGTLLVEDIGQPGEGVAFNHDGLTNGVTYYYSAFTRDNQPSPHYSDPVSQQATPYAAPKPNLLVNGSMDSFTSGVADGWTSYTVNDPGNVLSFSADSAYYVTDPPAQRVDGIDHSGLPASGLTAAGIMQVVYGLTPGKVYHFGGFQDVFVEDYQADGTRYLVNFGLDPDGMTDPEPVAEDGTIGGAKWMMPEQALWNKPIGSTVYYHGYHRSWASFPATSDSVSVWSGLTIDNQGTRDNAAARFYSDECFLFEWDFPANAGLVNTGFEDGHTDLQTHDPSGGGGDIIPDGWIPAGGGIGQWNNISVEDTAARSGNWGVLFGNRRGTVNAALMQKISCTPGELQTFTAYAKASGQDATTVAVGIDPKGIGDVTSPHITWTTTMLSDWTELTASAIAQTDAVVVFLRVSSSASSGTGGYHTGFFDDCSYSESAGLPPGTINGTVTDRCLTPLVGATVSTDVGGFTTTTLADGSYVLSGVHEGFYRVEASMNGYAMAGVDDVEVLSGQSSVANISLPDDQSGHIAGVVINHCGQPVSGALVEVSTGCYEATTAADGSYTIENVPIGSYEVYVTASEYNTAVVTDVAVGDGGTTDVQVTLDPAMTGTITGKVVDSCGQPLQGASVMTTPGCHSATSNSTGDYQFNNVMAGAYSVRVALDGYYPTAQENVQVTDGQLTDVNLVMPVSGEQEWIYNGTFNLGFFHFWGGDMATGWGAVWRNPYPDDDLNPWASVGQAVRMKELTSGFEAGIRQEITGLPVGAPYRFSAEAYQFASTTSAWLAVDTGTQFELPPRAESVQFPATTGQWVSQEVTGFVGADGRLRVHVWGYRESGYTEEVYFDNASLMIGVPLPPGDAVIGCTPSTFDIVQPEGSDAPPQVFELANAGCGGFDYTIETTASWLEAAPVSGHIDWQSQNVTLTFSTAALSQGTYSAEVIVSAPGVSNSPFSIPVTVSVDIQPAGAADFDRDGDVDQKDFGHIQACFSGHLNPQTDLDCQDTLLDGDNDVDEGDISVFLDCMTGKDVSGDPQCGT